MIEEPLWQEVGIEEIAADAAGTVAHVLGLCGAGFEASLLACDDARIASLNEAFRGKVIATNVLSWPSEERGAPRPGGSPGAPVDPELGDIAIAYQTCRREAEDAGRQLKDHATHLVVHGLLHLLGYDHDRDADATLMEGIETQALGNLGIDDPYRAIA